MVDERLSPEAEQFALEVRCQSGAVEGGVEAQSTEDQLSDVEELEAMAAPREEFHRQAAEKIVAWYP